MVNQLRVRNMRRKTENNAGTGDGEANRRGRRLLLYISWVILITIPPAAPARGAEIFIDRTGVRALNFGDLTDGTVNDLRNDPVPDFNWYIGRDHVINPIEWTHQWDPAMPSDGSIPLDADEVYLNTLAAELFPVIWDIDYPVSNEHDPLYWDTIPYAGGTGLAFSNAGNPGVRDLGLLEGNNNYWGAKRISLNPALLPPGEVEYFWVRVSAPTGGSGWKTSIDYVDLAIIFNIGALDIDKTAAHASGFDPPRVGYTSTYRVRVDIRNPTLTSSGGPMYDVLVTDVFPAGSTIATAPSLGTATIDAAGNLTWNAGILQDGALNAPPAAGSSDFMEVLVSVTPAFADEGNTILLNAGATITGAQVPLDPGDGTGTLYPFNFHGNAANQTTAVSVLVTTPNVAPANTGSITSTASILPGQPVIITVTDDDLNASAASAQTVSVNAVNQATGETEAVTLTETGVNTGIFAGTLTTVFGATAGADNSGSMNAQAGDTLRATYSDAVTAAGTPATVTDDTAVTGGFTATLTATASVLPGVNITLTLTDNDLNTNPATVQTVLLTTTNSRTGESELLTYTENGPNTGVFTASLPTAFSAAAGSNNSGTMNCMASDSLSTTYADALTGPGTTATISASTLVNGGGDGVLITTASIIPGQSVTVTLIDTDLDTTAAADTFTITLTDTSTGESETVILTETGGGTSVFTATVPTVFNLAAGANNDGVFNVQSGHIVSGTYVDTVTSSGGQTTSTATTAVTGGSTAAIFAIASILPGELTGFTVTDADLNVSALISETFNLNAVNLTTLETESLLFSETGPNSGSFSATVSTIFGAAAGTNNDGIFNVQAGELLRVTYSDALTAAGGQSVISAATLVLGTVTGTIDSSATVTPGGAVSVTLTDSDLNRDANAVETATVTAANPANGDAETLTLTETGVNTGIFTATAATRYNGAVISGDAFLSVVNGNTITFTYNDAMTATGGPTGITDTTAVVDNANFVTITSPIGSYNTASHNVTGTTDPLSSLRMTHPITGNTLTTTADANGAYTFAAVTFPEGITVYTVTSTDPAGNNAAAAATVNIDTTNFITVSSPIANSTITQIRGSVTGTTDAFAAVTLIEPATGLTLSGTADANGAFTFTDVDYLAGANTLSLTSTDSLNNIATAVVPIFVDPNILLTITSITDGAQYKNPIQSVSGLTDPDAMVTTTDPITGAALRIQADGFGRYSFGSFTFTNGPHTVTVNATDPVGNTAATLVSFAIVSANTNTITTEGTFTGATNDISGTTNPNSTVTMMHPVNGQALTAIATAGGVYTFEDVYLPDGAYTVTTISTDPLGNVAVDSAAFVIDATVSVDVDLPPDHSVVTDPAIDVSGTTDPGATVTIIDPATDLPITVTAGPDGSFTIPGINLNPGENIITLVIIDPSGNATNITQTIVQNSDIGLTVVLPEQGSVVHDSDQTVSGVTTPGATVTIVDPITGNTLTTTAGPDGSYTFDNVTFPPGANSISVTADDGAYTVTTTIDFIVASVGGDGELSASDRAVFGFPIFIEVTDPETYLDAARIDTLTVQVTNPATGDSELRTLLETTANSGVFRGVMATFESGASDGVNSGALAVQFGDIVTTSYTDAIRADGSRDTMIEAETLITNDEVRINVAASTFTGRSAITPLVNHGIAILEFDANEKLTGNVNNYITNDQGNIPTEFIGRMRRGHSYRVIIKDQFNGSPYSSSDAFAVETIEALPPDSRGVRTLTLVLDPAGYVYDAVTGARIGGADVILYHEGGARVAGPFAVFSQNPPIVQTNPQLSGDSGVPGGFEFIGSSAGSDITAGNYYITVTFDTTPALAALYDPILLSPGPWAGIQQPYTGQLFLVDQQNQPIGMRVPLVPQGLSAPLAITKAANKDTAAVGEFVTFVVSVRNLGNAATDPSSPVNVRDILPVGLTYVDNSAVFADGDLVPVTKFGGGELYFEIGQLMPAGDAMGRDSAVIYYQAVIDTSTRPGALLNNQAVALISGFTLSGTARATVRVVADPLFDQATLLGRVFEDKNRNGALDPGEPGIPDVGVLLDDGTYISTDEKGLYSVAGVTPGLETTGMRVVKIAMRDLPANAILTTPESVFVTLTAGGMDKANFGVYFAETAAIATDARDDAMFTAMFDLGIGEVRDGAGDGVRPDRDIIPEGGYVRGRTAAVFSGTIDGKYKITTVFDSNKRHDSNISRDTDRDRFYPTYGDNSSVTYLGDTQGRFFLDAVSPSSHLRIGNYAVTYPGADLAGVRRTLYGGLFEVNNTAATRGTAGEDHLTLFAAKDRQLHTRVDLRAHGGSYFLMAHDNIVPGSEALRVEIRDALAPDRVLAVRPLTRSIDYEIDSHTGAVRLFAPLAAFDTRNALNNAGVNGGNPVWLVAEYAYSPERGDFGTAGARWLHWTPDGFGLGASYTRENTDGTDHTLRGIDVHFRDNDRELFRAEWAHSVAGGTPWYQSLDGGQSFVELGNKNSSQGRAFKAEFKIPGIKNTEWENYFARADADFTGAYNERGVRRWGTRLRHTAGNREWKLDFTHAVSLPGATRNAAYHSGGTRSESLRVSFTRTFSNGSFATEFLRQYNQTPDTTTGLAHGTTSSLAIRYEHRMTDRITLALKQQVTLSSRDNHQTTLGVNYKMRKDMDFTTELTAGSAGTGARLGFEKRLSDGGTIYGNVNTGADPLTGGRRNGTTMGASGRITDSLSAHAETETVSTDSENIARRTLGLSQTYDAGGGLNTVMSFERSHERSSLNGNYITNALNISFDYAGLKDTRITAGCEYRRMRGEMSRNAFGFHFNARGRLRPGIDFSAEYDFEVSSDLELNRADSKSTRAVLGMAFRPLDNDRLNVIARIGRVRDMRSPALNNSFIPDTITTIYALEGLYDLRAGLTLHQKIASKTVNETIAPLPRAQSHTTLWISGLDFNPRGPWDYRVELRAAHQPTQLNHKDGAAVQAGYTIKDTIRLGVGYNFSSYSDDEFQTLNHSYKGLFFTIQGKI